MHVVYFMRDAAIGRDEVGYDATVLAAIFERNKKDTKGTIWKHSHGYFRDSVCRGR